jgi:predicted outer membrane repeat protein
VRLAVCLALAAFVASPAYADAVVTLCSVDAQLGSGVNLAQALTTGGVIRFSCPRGTVLRVTRTYRLTASTRIDGANQVTLDGNGLSGPMLEAGPANLIVSRIAMRGFVPPPPPTHVVEPGLTLAPALIETSGQLELDDVTFDDLAYPVVASGGIWAHDSSFSTPPGRSNYTLTVRGDAFVDHDRFVGGSGVRLAAGTIHGSSFSTMTGPAVSIELPTGPVEIRASTFVAGKETAILVTQRARGTQTPTITIRDNAFSGNVGSDGGAIDLVGIPPGVHEPGLAGTSPVRLITGYNRFQNNKAQTGGAIDADLGNTEGWQSTGDLFIGNAASLNGGAVSISGGAASIGHALFADNRASAKGGAISVADQSPVILENALAVRNAAATGVFAGGQFTIANATIAENQAVGLLGGASTRVNNTIFAGNRPSDCSGLPLGTFVGPNLQSDGSCPDAPTGEAYLDPMFVPAPGSPVRTAGDLASCRAAPVNGSDLLFQERGLGGFCALGALEAIPVRSLQQAVSQPFPHGTPSDDFPDADTATAGSGGSGPSPPGGQSGGSSGGSSYSEPNSQPY